MILPRKGRIAWNWRSRPPSALPPAESPSTRYSSQRSTSRLVQSRSLPGSPPPVRAPLRSRTRARALRALSRASAASEPLLHDDPRGLGVLFEEAAEVVADGGVDDPLDLAVAELGLGLAFELRIGHAERDHGREPLADVVAGGHEVLEEVLLLAVGVERAGQGGAEAGDVRAAFGGGDVVDEGVDVLGVLRRVLHGDFQADPLVLAGNVDDLRMHRLAGAVQVLDELEDPALVLKVSPSPVRSSRKTILMPRFRNASSWRRR